MKNTNNPLIKANNKTMIPKRRIILRKESPSNNEAKKGQKRY